MQTANPPDTSSASFKAPTCKVLLIGDMAVGKTHLAKRFVDGIWTPETIVTTGEDYAVKIVNVNNVSVKVQVWDTQGQERHASSVTCSFYRNVVGIIFVYDITNLESYHHIQNWVAQADAYATPGYLKVVAANKSDLDAQRVVKTEGAQNWAASIGGKYLETSALTGNNVEEAFMFIAKWKAKLLAQTSDASPKVKRSSNSAPPVTNIAPPSKIGVQTKVRNVDKKKKKKACCVMAWSTKAMWKTVLCLFVCWFMREVTHAILLNTKNMATLPYKNM